MENEELLYAIIRTAIDKGINYIEEYPKRGIRNLVDLGEYFATGRFQKDFFQIAHEILNNEESSYYQLIGNTVKNINHETLINFGINLGYNSWTKGARIVRQREIKHGYNIPWTIVFDFEEISENQLTNAELTNFISSGGEIGIYCYMFMIGNNFNSLEDLLLVLKQYKDYAFILFINPGIITREIAENINLESNIAVSLFIDDSETENVNVNEALLKSTKLLFENKCLFGVYKYFDNNNEKNMKILSGEFAKKILDTNCTFAFLIKKENCSDQNAKLISEFIKSAKTKNNSPVFLMNFYEDIDNINKNISVESCFLSINSYGQATVSSLYNHQTNFNIRYNSLEQILSNTMPKVKN